MGTELTNLGPGGLRRGGFTLVEMLVTIGIIVLLVTLGIVVAGKALGTSKRAATLGFLQSMGTALEAFKNDFGDYPPLVTRLADYSNDEISAPKAIATPEVWGEKTRLASPGNLAAARMATKYEYENARWMSEWSPAVYLLGVGDTNGDGDTDKDLLDLDDGKEGFGFRHPGKDFLAWTRIEDGELVHEPTEEGRTYGPYLDEGQVDKFIERVPVVYDATGTKRIEATTSGSSDQYLYRFVDSFGNPIRYYKNWRTKDPDTGMASVDFAPVELRSYAGLNDQYENDRDHGDLSLDAEVMRAPYMLLAAGAKPIEQGDATIAPFGDTLPTTDGGMDRLYRFQELEGSFDSAFNVFNVVPSAYDRIDLLKLYDSNVRYSP